MDGFGLVLVWFWSCFWFGGCCVTGEIDLKCKDGEIDLDFRFTFKMRAW